MIHSYTLANVRFAYPYSTALNEISALPTVAKNMFAYYFVLYIFKYILNYVIKLVYCLSRKLKKFKALEINLNIMNTIQ